MIVKMLKKSQTRINFESNNGKTMSHLKGNSIRLFSDFSAETIKAMRQWDNIVSVQRTTTKKSVNQESYN